MIESMDRGYGTRVSGASLGPDPDDHTFEVVVRAPEPLEPDFTLNYTRADGRSRTYVQEGREVYPSAEQKGEQ